MKLIVVRHGTTYAPGEDSRYLGIRLDPPLSETGRVQARDVARALAHRWLRPEAIVSGPHLRHRQTADLLAARFGGTPSIEADLAEIDYGPWEGLAKEEIEARWPGDLLAWKKRGVWPAAFGGSFSMLSERLRAWLKRLEVSGAKTIVAVSSQGTLRGLYDVVAPSAWEEACKAGRATLANIDRGGWGEIEILDGKPDLVRWNARPSIIDRLPF